MWLCGWPVAATSLSPQEVQTVGRALAFMQPPPTAGSVAVVFSAADQQSKRDAEAIAAEIGPGLAVGSARLPPRVVEASALQAGGFAVVLAAAGANSPALGSAVQAAHVLCVTAELKAVQDGDCTMAVSTGMRVQIVLNHAAAAAAGINFIAAFRMMIREI